MIYPYLFLFNLNLTWISDIWPTVIHLVCFNLYLPFCPKCLDTDLPHLLVNFTFQLSMNLNFGISFKIYDAYTPLSRLTPSCDFFWLLVWVPYCAFCSFGQVKSPFLGFLIPPCTWPAHDPMLHVDNLLTCYQCVVTLRIPIFLPNPVHGNPQIPWL